MAQGNQDRRLAMRALVVLAGLVVACSSGSGSGGSGGSGGSSGTGGSGSGTTCRQACEKVEQVCPGTWPSIDDCEQQCQTEPFPQSSLDCVMTASDCAGVDACST